MIPTRDKYVHCTVQAGVRAILRIGDLGVKVLQDNKTLLPKDILEIETVSRRISSPRVI